MKTANEANWYLVFKVTCPYCGHLTSTYNDYISCWGCLKKFKVSKKIQVLRARVDEHLNEPYPPAVIRKDSV